MEIPKYFITSVELITCYPILLKELICVRDKEFFQH